MVEQAIPIGVYGALEGQPLQGQNWRGKTGDWFKKTWSSMRFEARFTTSSCDEVGAVQIRGDGEHWLVAFTRPFAARNQTTWRVARLAAGQLWDGLLPVVRGLRELDDAEVLQRSELRVSIACNADDRARRRALLPLLRRLADVELPGSAEHKTVCPDGVEAFEDLLVCAAFTAEPCADRGTEHGVAVLSRPAARREHKELLEAGWDAIFAPAPPPAEDGESRNTTPFGVAASDEAILGAAVADVAALPDREFDAVFGGFRGGAEGDRRWVVPYSLIDPNERDRAEWAATLAGLLGGDRDVGDARSVFERITRATLLARRVELALWAERDADSIELSKVFLAALDGETRAAVIASTGAD